MYELTKIERFQLFCLESFKNAKGIKASDVFKLFKDTDVFDYLANGYEVLHTQGRNFILADIGDYILQRK
jgi:hypothetical protein